MYQYRVVVGTADPSGDGSPDYYLHVAKRQKSLDEPRPDSLEAVLNQMAADGWEPWQFALPTVYPIVGDRAREAPVTLIFRREGMAEDGPEGQ